MNRIPTWGLKRLGSRALKIFFCPIETSRSGTSGRIPYWRIAPIQKKSIECWCIYHDSVSNDDFRSLKNNMSKFHILCVKWKKPEFNVSLIISPCIYFEESFSLRNSPHSLWICEVRESFWSFLRSLTHYFSYKIRQRYNILSKILSDNVIKILLSTCR